MGQDSLSRIDFSDNRYTVKQRLIRNKYQVTDSQDRPVVRAKQKLFKMKEEFPFTDPEGNVVFRIKAGHVLDIAGDYALIDEETGETIANLNKKFTLLKHVWYVEDPDTGERWATIESRSTALELLRALSDILSFIPHRYDITGPNGEDLGSIDGRFRLKDTYDIEISDDASHREAIVAVAIAIDALEGN